MSRSACRRLLLLGKDPLALYHYINPESNYIPLQQQYYIPADRASLTLYSRIMRTLKFLIPSTRKYKHSTESRFFEMARLKYRGKAQQPTLNIFLYEVSQGAAYRKEQCKRGNLFQTHFYFISVSFTAVLSEALFYTEESKGASPFDEKEKKKGGQEMGLLQKLP